jgi:hypothetical protein
MTNRERHAWAVMLLIMCIVVGLLGDGVIPTRAPQTITKTKIKRVYRDIIVGGGVTPPASINDTCGADVTVQLNTFFASLAPNTTVTLPRIACYLVSQSAPSGGVTLIQGFPDPVSGGSLSAGTYCYEISSLNALNQPSVPGPSGCATLTTTGAILLNWNIPAAAAGFNVYRENPGSHTYYLLSSFSVSTSGISDDGTYTLGSQAAPTTDQQSNDLLTLTGLTGITINGNGATFKQTTYYSCVGGGGVNQAVVSMWGDSNVTINNVTIEGPGQHYCGSGNGGDNEGDVGLRMEPWGNCASSLSNTNITFNGVEIEYAAGDDFDIYGCNGGFGAAINKDILFENGHVIDSGYDLITDEEFYGLTITHSIIYGAGENILNAEIDTGCWPPNYDPAYPIPGNACGVLGAPLTGEEGLTLENDTFPEGFFFEDTNGCLPMGDLDFLNNEVTGAMVFQLGALNSTLADLTACTIGDNDPAFGTNLANASGLVIEGNTSTAAGNGMFSGVGPIVIVGWSNVTIEQNSFYVSSIYAGVALCDVNNGVVIDNTFNGANASYTTSPSSCLVPSGVTSSNLTVCGNYYGVNAAALDQAC